MLINQLGFIARPSLVHYSLASTIHQLKVSRVTSSLTANAQILTNFRDTKQDACAF